GGAPHDRVSCGSIVDPAPQRGRPGRPTGRAGTGGASGGHPGPAAGAGPPVPPARGGPARPPRGAARGAGLARAAAGRGARRGGGEVRRMDELGDFSTSPRMVLIAAIAVGVGALSAFVALALLRLIGLFTNLFFFGRWSTDLVSPAGNHLGL